MVVLSAAKEREKRRRRSGIGPSISLAARPSTRGPPPPFTGATAQREMQTRIVVRTNIRPNERGASLSPLSSHGATRGGAGANMSLKNHRAPIAHYARALERAQRRRLLPARSIGYHRDRRQASQPASQPAESSVPLTQRGTTRSWLGAARRGAATSLRFGSIRFAHRRAARGGRCSSSCSCCSLTRAADDRRWRPGVRQSSHCPCVVFILCSVSRSARVSRTLVVVSGVSRDRESGTRRCSVRPSEREKGSLG